MFWLVMAHSVMRWIILAAAVAALVGARAASDRGAGRWGSRAGLAFTIALDVQVLLGLIIWFLETGWRHNAFFAFVHPVTMIAATLIAHVGRTRQKRSTPAAGFWAYLVALILVVAAIPWWA